ncbi:hypothetical protein [Oryzobacter telluris]|uniref:hypothetical protein n=1 Tax=Oryzobacter telluris TaxID=3149179 RepID=UPI00370D5539
MTTTTTARSARTLTTPSPSSVRPAALTTGAGGLLLGAGGQLHPRGSGATVDAYLSSMLGDPGWATSHVLLLAGTVTTTIGLALLRRSGATGPRVAPWLLAAVVGWAVAALELVPHLFAVNDAEALAHHGDTPVLDLHLLAQVVATPALGLTAAALAVAVARAAGTWPARLLAVPGVLGGLGYAAAGPLVATTHDLAVTPLFALQAGVAVWLVGTAVRLLAGRRAPAA